MIGTTRCVVKRMSYDVSERLYGPVWDAFELSLGQLRLQLKS